MDTQKIGFHISIEELVNNYSFYKEKGHNVFQVFLGSPRSYGEPNGDSYRLFLERNPGADIETVVHSPYWVSLAANPTERIYQTTLRYSIQMSKLMVELGIRYYVTHIGSRKEEDPKLAVKYIRDFCLRWLSLLRVMIQSYVRGNDSGSKAGTKMGFIRVLELVVKNVNSPRVKMVYDTEHAYANGADLSDIDRIKRTRTTHSSCSF